MRDIASLHNWIVSWDFALYAEISVGWTWWVMPGRSYTNNMTPPFYILSLLFTVDSPGHIHRGVLFQIRISPPELEKVLKRSTVPEEVVWKVVKIEKYVRIISDVCIMQIFYFSRQKTVRSNHESLSNKLKHFSVLWYSNYSMLYPIKRIIFLCSWIQHQILFHIQNSKIIHALIRKFDEQNSWTHQDLSYFNANLISWDCPCNGH